MRSDVLTLFAILVAMAVLGVMPEPARADRRIPRQRVPRAVMGAFEKTYPRATIRACAREVEGGVTYFEIESVDGGTRRDLLYRSDGTVAEIEEVVSAGVLPADARQTIEALRPRAVIRTVERVTRADTTRFDVVVAQGRRTSTFTFDGAGHRVH